MRSIRRMVKPGGIAILSTPNRLVSSPNGGVSDPTHLREYTPSEFEAVLRAGGFTNVALQGQHFGEGLGKMHALRAKMGRWDVLGLRRLLPGFFKAKILKRTAQVAMGDAVEPSNMVWVDSDLNGAYVQIAICSG